MISNAQREPSGTACASVGKHGSMNPAGGLEMESARTLARRIMPRRGKTRVRINRGRGPMPRVRKPSLPKEALDTAQPSGNGSLVPRDANGRVLEGAVLNPAGRTPGSKNRIAEAFLKDCPAGRW